MRARFCWVPLTFALACGSARAQPGSAACLAHSRPTPPAVVELYTSEGCSSCPPADRWLSGFKGRADVLALAFHVNYWDRLGWPDRFATPATTARQHGLQRASGARHVYTPQVLVNGRDEPAWSQAAPQPLAPSALHVTLAGDGARVRADVVAARPGAPAQVAGYWALLEDGHASRVQRGENSGRTLAHDHVVRLYRPLPAWPAASAQTFTLDLPAPDGPAARRVAFVVTDAGGGRPLQAVVLGC